jgi:hypothetical protein
MRRPGRSVFWGPAARMDSRVDEFGTSIGLAQRRIVKTGHGLHLPEIGPSQGRRGRVCAFRRRRPLARLEVLCEATVTDTRTALVYLLAALPDS